MSDSPSLRKVAALLKCILRGTPLIGDLPEANHFSRSSLSYPKEIPELNLQQKLGHLFEDTLASLITASDQLELFEQGLQLRDEDLKTVGELDFLIKDHKARTLIHLELATKFYLAVNTANGFALPGPDARDNYYRKLARMREHQLRLPVKFRDCLPPQYKNTLIETQQLVFGCLFDHIDASKTFTPEFAREDCRRGKWLHQSDCDRYFCSNSRFEIIPKALWPVPFEFLETIELKAWAPSKPIDRCLMVRANKEFTPFFIAPAGYPSRN